MSKVEAGHHQQDLQGSLPDESSLSPQLSQKRQYHRRIEPELSATTNPNIFNEEQTPLTKPGTPYYRKEGDNLQTNQLLSDYSLDRLRASIHRKIYTSSQQPKPEKNISLISQNYFDSESYRQSIKLLTSLITPIEPDEAKTEHSYRLGLTRNLRVLDSLTKGINQEDHLTINKIINQFELHCQTVTQKFTANEKYKHLKATFHLLIQYPDLHHPDILDQLVPQITDESFLTYFVINQLFRSKRRDAEIIDIVSKKTKIFEKLKEHNQRYQLGATISDMRIATVFRSDPFAFLEKTADTNRQKKRHQSKAEQLAKKTEQKQHREGRIKIQRFGRALSDCLEDIKKRPIEPSEQQTLFPMVKELYQYLEPVSIRRGLSESKTDQNRERIIQNYLDMDHPFLTRETIEYYLNRYHNYDEEIRQVLPLYDALTQKYQDNPIAYLKPVIVESIKRRRRDAYISIGKYINLMSNPKIKEKITHIPKPITYGIFTKYIYEKNIDIGRLLKDLENEAINW